MSQLGGFGGRFTRVLVLLALGACDDTGPRHTGADALGNVSPPAQPDSQSPSPFDPGVPGDPLQPCDPAVGVSANPIVLTPPVPRPLTWPATQLTPTPPAISGGTLLALRDGSAVVASDPDRDRIYVVDVVGAALRATLVLDAGDEPGRAVEDALGRVHVVLRRAGAVVVIDPDAGTQLARHRVCDVPRGIAYDAASDAIHVACAEGKLVTLSAASGAVTRTLELDRDLRDVAVSRNELLVSRFRSAELLRIAASGALTARITPARAARERVASTSGPCANPTSTAERDEFAPTVAWRMQAMPDGGVALLHQRSEVTQVRIQSGGYGASGTCNVGVVQSVITLDAANPDSSALVFPTLGSVTLAVDLAVDPTSRYLALAVPGDWGLGNGPVRVYERLAIESSVQNAEMPVPAESCVSENGASYPDDQVTAVAFVSASRLAVQTREPANLYLYNLAGLLTPVAMPAEAVPVIIALSDETRRDTGHDVFHLRAGAGIACASCHAEGGDDGHVWDFQDIGARRTQHVRGGIVGTEPLHWDGDMQTFEQLATEVFVRRMGAASVAPEQVAAAQRWIDLQPALARTPVDAAAVQRGQVLFESEALGCTTCHAGPSFTNNMSVDVGTGGALQVPSLRGLAFRAPYLHDGCAPTLLDRFGPCGGGDEHGKTSQLGSEELQDLIAYLETL